MTHVRSDKKILNAKTIKELFIEGIFVDVDKDTFSAAQLNLFVEMMINGMPLPLFGAREDAHGNPHFKSGKLRQVVTAVEIMVNIGELSQLSARKLSGTYLEFVVISESDFYNPGITREQIENYLALYL